MKRILSVLFAAGLIVAAGAAQAGQYKVVVNKANGISSLSKADCSKIFLKKSTRWADGTKAEPVDLEASSPVREAFSEAVHGKNASAIKSYWQRKVFSGRGVPPPEKVSDTEVIDYVKSTPGAVGYVSEAAAASGVKVIVIE